MRGVSDLITKINSIISGGVANELQLIQLSGAVESIEKHGVASVTTPSDLPNPVMNKGRFLFVESTSSYVFSNGVGWSVDGIIQTPLYNWGAGNGVNSTANTSSPVAVIGGFTDWVRVETGDFHTVGVRANGTAWAWGNNGYGRLGDGTTANRLSPVSVVGGFTDWVQVCTGNIHTVGVRANGTAWAWGAGSQGRLGDGTTVSKSSPVSVVGGFTDWVQVDANSNHTVGIRSNGTAWAWGINGGGRLGDGTTVDRSSPVSVVGGFTDWVQVVAGSGHSVGIRANGTAWTWGFGSNGALGDGTTISKSSPVSVIGGFTDWVSADADSHTIGIRANGTAWAWGFGTFGRLGDNSATNKSSPVSVVGGFTDWVQIKCAGHSIGIRANGTAWGWGYNNQGQVGDNTTTARQSPVAVVGGFTNWIGISAGERHSTGLKSS